MKHLNTNVYTALCLESFVTKTYQRVALLLCFKTWEICFLNHVLMETEFPAIYLGLMQV